jgi:hypothetical protein
VLRRIPLLLLGVSLVACASATETPAADLGAPNQTADVSTDNEAGAEVDDGPDATDTAVSGTTPSVDQGTTDQSTDTAPPVVEVPEALRFSAPLIGGGEIDLAGFAGRPVLLWFWSPF